MRRLALVLTLAAGPALATGLEIDVEGEANGTIVIDLFDDVAPKHVARIVELANQGAYDGVVFHRVIDGFMAQTGDVEFGRADGDLSSAGLGGSDLPDLPAEVSDVEFAPGIVGMARSSGMDTANSQFFIVTGENARHLVGQYTAIGEVASGLDVAQSIKLGEDVTGAVDGAPDVMRDVRVTE